jgi:predicted phosphodiesterase
MSLVALSTGCSQSELGNLAAPSTGDMSLSPSPRATFDDRLFDACGPGGATELGLDNLIRQPYLQKVTHESMEVLWTTESTDRLQVRVTTADGEVLSEAAAAVDDSSRPLQGTQYVTRLEGLEPNATLCYEIIGSDGHWFEPTGFRTAPLPGDSTAPIRIMVFGDVGTRTSDQYAVLDQMRTVEFDMSLVAGDIAYDDGKKVELENHFFGVYHELMSRAAFFPASGNHDYHTADASPFREFFALFENGGPEGIERWYSFDWGDLHVAVIDTEVLKQAQYDWLDQDLANTDKTWKIVVGHRPPYSSGTHGSDADVRNAFSPIMERHGVQLAIFGHEHDYERTKKMDGVTYLVTGGAGRGTRPVGTSSFTEFSAQVAHFVYLEIQGDELSMFAIDGEGNDFDTLRLVAN